MTYIITDTCVECGKCEPECPVDAISSASPYTINDSCVDCGVCAAICPVDAIYRSPDSCNFK